MDYWTQPKFDHSVTSLNLLPRFFQCLSWSFQRSKVTCVFNKCQVWCLTVWLNSGGLKVCLNIHELLYPLFSLTMPHLPLIFFPVPKPRRGGEVGLWKNVGGWERVQPRIHKMAMHLRMYFWGAQMRYAMEASEWKGVGFSWILNIPYLSDCLPWSG